MRRNKPAFDAEELNRLCNLRWPSGGMDINTQLALAINERTGRGVDRQYVYRIRKALVRKVAPDTRAALADYFGMPADHFERPPRAATAEQESEAFRDALDALAVHGLSLSGLRSKENLSAAGQAELERILDHIVELRDRELSGQEREQ